MARPALVDIQAGVEGWDSLFDDNMEVLRGPLPIKLFSTVAAILATNPANYEGCVCTNQEDWSLWISNGVAWAPVAGSTRGAYSYFGYAESESSALSGASYTFTSLIPAGVRLLGVSGRVTTLVTGATSFHVGDGSDADRFSASVAPALGTTFSPQGATADPGGWSAAAGNVVLTAVGGNFSAGKVRACAHYIRSEAPQS